MPRPSYGIDQKDKKKENLMETRNTVRLSSSVSVFSFAEQGEKKRTEDLWQRKERKTKLKRFFLKRESTFFYRTRRNRGIVAKEREKRQN